ncbi:MAG TPA: zinc ribbon domain-containing protein, partial [Labilithrix sp.]|nr:zinc ribbon domain-containing protein [Labilithrix sp.]
MSTKPCPQCGSVSAKEARFCGQCGYTFAAATAFLHAVRIPKTLDDATADPSALAPPATTTPRVDAPPPAPLPNPQPGALTMVGMPALSLTDHQRPTPVVPPPADAVPPAPVSTPTLMDPIDA